MFESFQPEPSRSVNQPHPRMHGELIDQPAQIALSFNCGELPCNLCVDHQNRRIVVRIDVGSSMTAVFSPGSAVINPAKQRAAIQITEHVRGSFEGVIARLGRFLTAERQAVIFEGPFMPVDRTCVELEARVTRDTNFDRTYDYIKQLLETHPLNDNQLCPLPTPPPAVYAWTEQEMDWVEGKPKEDGTPEALAAQPSDGSPRPQDGAAREGLDLDAAAHAETRLHEFFAPREDEV